MIFSFLPLILKTWTSVANKFATETDSSVQNTRMSTITLLIVKVAMRGEVERREKLKIVLFRVRGTNVEDPPYEINLEPLYPSRGMETFHLK